MNLPDLRTFDFLAQKQTLAVHIAKRSKYKRLLSLHVDSMSSSGRNFKMFKCSFYHECKRVGNCKKAMKVSSKKTGFYPNVGSNAIQRQARTAREERAASG